jgi:LPS O-antigen subunit length determinant protein (WzzB/FepE family)
MSYTSEQAMCSGVCCSFWRIMTAAAAAAAAAAACKLLLQNVFVS